MEVLFFWLFLSFVAGMIASRRGRSGIGFFLLSVILSPLVGIIMALVVRSGHVIDNGPQRVCPYCAELIMPAAIKCKHCGSNLQPAPVEPIEPPAAYTLGKTLGRTFKSK